MPKTKVCGKCKKRKSISTFSKNKSSPDGLYSICKKCRQTYAQQRNSTKKGKHLERKGYLKYKYDITLEKYDQLFIEQGGLCYICGNINSNGKRLCVDHNHKTGRIRGLLCTACNSALGAFQVDEKDIKLLIRAISYIRRQ